MHPGQRYGTAQETTKAHPAIWHKEGFLSPFTPGTKVHASPSCAQLTFQQKGGENTPPFFFPEPGIH